MTPEELSVFQNLVKVVQTQNLHLEKLYRQQEVLTQILIDEIAGLSLESAQAIKDRIHQKLAPEDGSELPAPI